MPTLVTNRESYIPPVTLFVVESEKPEVEVTLWAPRSRSVGMAEAMNWNWFRADVSVVDGRKFVNPVTPGVRLTVIESFAAVLSTRRQE